MTTAVAIKLVAVLLTAALGYGAGRFRLLTHGASDSDAARVLSNAALYVFVPALLFRTTARIDYAHMPWRIIAAYFVPVLAVAFLVYAWHHVRSTVAVAAAIPATRAMAVAFGNSVQLGIPMATALFGEEGLALHIPLVSLHALTLLTVLTVLVELDLARAAHGRGTGLGSMRRALATTVRNTVLHPVLLPVFAGLVWHLVGLPIPAFMDEVLVLLGTRRRAALPRADRRVAGAVRHQRAIGRARRSRRSASCSCCRRPCCSRRGSASASRACRWPCS